MRFFALFALVLFAGCSSSEENTGKEKSQLLLSIGGRQLAQGHPRIALKSLLSALKEAPNNKEVLNHIGLAYFAINETEKAKIYFSRALSVDSKYTNARINLARMLTEQNRGQEALVQLNVARKDLLFAKQETLELVTGLAYFRLQKYSKAVRYFSTSLELNNEQCLAQTYLGRSYYELNQLQSANDIFSTAVPLCQKTKNDEAHYYAALSQFKSGKKLRGIALMNETILLYPKGKYNRRAQRTLELMRLNRVE